MKYDCVVWDWNGTLLDDYAAALECVNDMLDGIGAPRIDGERYYSLIDTPIIKFYYGLFGTEDIDFDSISRGYHEAYSSKLAKIGLSEGAQSILGYIKETGAEQLIVTAAHADEVRSLAEKFCISEYFTAILGAEDYLAQSKTDRAKGYFSTGGVPHKRILAVGDTLHDAETAEALGADCVLLSTGHQGRKILESSGYRVIDRLCELVDILKED